MTIPLTRQVEELQARLRQKAETKSRPRSVPGNASEALPIGGDEVPTTKCVGNRMQVPVTGGYDVPIAKQIGNFLT